MSAQTRLARVDALARAGARWHDETAARVRAQLDADPVIDVQIDVHLRNDENGVITVMETYFFVLQLRERYAPEREWALHNTRDPQTGAPIATIISRHDAQSLDVELREHDDIVFLCGGRHPAIPAMRKNAIQTCKAACLAVILISLLVRTLLCTPLLCTHVAALVLDLDAAKCAAVAAEATSARNILGFVGTTLVLLFCVTTGALCVMNTREHEIVHHRSEARKQTFRAVALPQLRRNEATGRALYERGVALNKAAC